MVGVALGSGVAEGSGVAVEVGSSVGTGVSVAVGSLVGVGCGTSPCAQPDRTETRNTINKNIAAVRIRPE